MKDRERREEKKGGKVRFNYNRGSPFDNRYSLCSQACRNNLVQHLDHLLFYGADMNARNASGNTPLHVCAVNNTDSSCIRQLLFRGAQKDSLNYANQTPYQVAVIAGNMELAEVIKNYQLEEVGECPARRRQIGEKNPSWIRQRRNFPLFFRSIEQIYIHIYTLYLVSTRPLLPARFILIIVRLTLPVRRSIVARSVGKLAAACRIDSTFTNNDKQQLATTRRRNVALAQDFARQLVKTF